MSSTVKVLVVEFVEQILSFDRPVATEHLFNAAANRIAPIHLLSVSIEKVTTARSGVAIIDDAFLVIHADAAASRVNNHVFIAMPTRPRKVVKKSLSLS